jgi:hypothetical protein
VVVVVLRVVGRVWGEAAAKDAALAATGLEWGSDEELKERVPLSL